MGCASGNFTEQWSHQRDHTGRSLGRIFHPCWTDPQPARTDGLPHGTGDHGANRGSLLTDIHIVYRRLQTE